MLYAIRKWSVDNFVTSLGFLIMGCEFVVSCLPSSAMAFCLYV